MNRASATTSPFATHLTRPLAHRFDTLEGSPSTLNGAIALCQPGPLFDGSMILFDDIVEVLALAQKNPAGESPLGFQGFHCWWIRIHVDDPRNAVGG
jgi:hypothetical protein